MYFPNNKATHQSILEKNKLSAKYMANFKQMFNAWSRGDKVLHTKYAKIERQLHWQELRLRDKMGIKIEGQNYIIGRVK